MHNFILKIFNFIKSTLEFFKIVLLFLMIGVVLLWVQSLIKTTWTNFGWFNSISAIFVDIGSLFTKEKIDIWGAIFELKYLVALLLLIFIYYLDKVLIKVNEHLEGFYNDCRQAVNKKIEHDFNKNLEETNTIQQKKITNYMVYISAAVKKQYEYRNINLNDEYTNINTFLTKQTGIQPQKYLDGYLYNFTNFETIDNVLTEFAKLISPKANLDFTICVQIIDKNSNDTMPQLDTLIGLNLINKISAFADTAWRYNFNTCKFFKTASLGIFQKNQKTYEAVEFVKK